MTIKIRIDAEVVLARMAILFLLDEFRIHQIEWPKNYPGTESVSSAVKPRPFQSAANASSRGQLE